MRGSLEEGRDAEEGRGNMVGTASALSLCFILKPSFSAVADVVSKHSALKCLLQTAELAVGPFHLALVFLICDVHVFLSFMSLGNWKRLTPFLFALEQPQTMQYLPIMVSC